MQTSLTPAQPLSLHTPTLSFLSKAFLFVCGILLPAITLVFESLTHMCAQGFFDPVPTVAHVFAIAAVPLANGFSLWVLARGDGTRIEAVMFGQAFAVAIAGLYALMFARIMPLAINALVGGMIIGILPLAPLLSLIASVRALFGLRRLRRALALPAARVVVGGLAAGIGLVIALDARATLTQALPGLTRAFLP